MKGYRMRAVNNSSLVVYMVYKLLSDVPQPHCAPTTPIMTCGARRQRRPGEVVVSMNNRGDADKRSIYSPDGSGISVCRQPPRSAVSPRQTPPPRQCHQGSRAHSHCGLSSVSHSLQGQPLCSVVALTHRRHPPWTCLHRTGQPRIPVTGSADDGSLTHTHTRLPLTVSTCPGSTSMTRIRVSISSFRSASVKARTAALVAQ